MRGLTIKREKENLMLPLGSNHKRFISSPPPKILKQQTIRFAALDNKVIDVKASPQKPAAEPFWKKVFTWPLTFLKKTWKDLSTWVQKAFSNILFVFTGKQKRFSTPEFSDIKDLKGSALHSLLSNALAEAPLGQGAQAGVFTLPGFKNMVLRQSNFRFSNKPVFDDDWLVLPIQYANQKVSEHQNLGVPIAVIVPKNHPLASKKVITPEMALDSETGATFMALRKMSGHPMNQDYVKQGYLLYGHDEEAEHRLKPLYIDLRSTLDELGSRKEQITGTQRMLEDCEQGVHESYYKFSAADLKLFHQRYQAFVTSYLASLAKTAELPQEAFNQAFKTLVDSSTQGILFDLSHVNNTFFDASKGKFRFVDLEFEAKPSKDNSARQTDLLNDFTRVCLGKRSVQAMEIPYTLILAASDGEKAIVSIRKLLAKLRMAATENNIKWDSSQVEREINWHFDAVLSPDLEIRE
jgi:hypothetical protein